MRGQRLKVFSPQRAEARAPAAGIEDILSENAFDLSINDDLGSTVISISSGSNQVAARKQIKKTFFVANLYFRPLPSLQSKPLSIG